MNDFLDIEALKENEFKENVKIRFYNILDGFDNFKNKLIEVNRELPFEEKERDIIDFFYNAFEKQDKFVIVDFYLGRLNDVEFNNLLDALDTIDKEILLKLRETLPKDNIYFKIYSKELLSFFVKLCTRELFFITFYFIKNPLTIWGNYDLKFPIFYLKEEDYKVYIK
ncbi:hypothetical protein [Clostridium sp.]|uniref:hypothetical protein n=1 Tax=Clostridium sp. TaxID=1506 RepID=UPI003F3EB630